MSKKISDLPAATQINTTDLFEKSDQGGAPSQKATGQQFLEFFNAQTTLLLGAGNITFHSDGSAQFSAGNIGLQSDGAIAWGAGTGALGNNGSAIFANGNFIVGADGSFQSGGSFALAPGAQLALNVDLVMNGGSVTLFSGTGNVFAAGTVASSAGFVANGNPGLTQNVTISGTTLHFVGGILVNVT